LVTLEGATLSKPPEEKCLMLAHYYCGTKCTILEEKRNKF